MSKPRVPSVSLSGMDDLFGITGNINEVNEIPLNQCRDFKNHPFRVLDDEDMEKLIDSIKVNGKVLEPVLLRPAGKESYEIISGHRRCAAAKKCGFVTIPAIVREYTDDEATVIMVDANLRRENLSYSEKAWAYRMKYDVLKHQGKAAGSLSADVLADGSNESAKTIQRLIRLTYLIPEMLNLVDAGNIPYLAGVDLSYLSNEEQEFVYSVIAMKDPMGIDGKTAHILKKMHDDCLIAIDAVKELLLNPPAKEAAPEKRVFTFKSDKIYNYFPKDTDEKHIQEVILRLLEKYQNELEG